MTSELNKVRLEAKNIDLNQENSLLEEKVSKLQRLLQIALNRASGLDAGKDHKADTILTSADFYGHSEVQAMLGDTKGLGNMTADLFFKQLRTACLTHEKKVNDKSSRSSKADLGAGGKSQEQYDELLTMYEVAKDECEDLKAQLEVALAEAGGGGSSNKKHADPKSTGGDAEEDAVKELEILRKSHASLLDRYNKLSQGKEGAGGSTASGSGSGSADADATKIEALKAKMQKIKDESDAEIMKLTEENVALQEQLDEALDMVEAAGTSGSSVSRQRSSAAAAADYSSPSKILPKLDTGLDRTDSISDGEVANMVASLKLAEERAQSDKKIALKVKEGAVRECALAKAEVARLKAQIQRQITEAKIGGTLSRHSSTTAEGGDERESPSPIGGGGGGSAASAAELARLRRELETAKAQLEIKENQSKNDRTSAQIAGDAQDDQIRDLHEKMEELLEGKTAAEEETARVVASHKHNVAETEAKYQQKIKELMSQNPSDDKTVVLANLEKSSEGYKKVIEAIENKTPEEQEEIISSIFYEYERKLSLATQDKDSLREIIKIKVEDTELQYKEQIEDLTTRTEILRMQIKEISQQEPHC